MFRRFPPKVNYQPTPTYRLSWLYAESVKQILSMRVESYVTKDTEYFFCKKNMFIEPVLLHFLVIFGV